MKKIRMCVAGLLAIVSLAGCGAETPEQGLANGLKAMQKGNLVEAKAKLERAMEMKPTLAETTDVLNDLGLVNWKLGFTNEAIAHFEFAIQQNPSAFAPLYNLGTLALSAGDVSRGISTLRKAADLDPKDTRAVLYIAEWGTRNASWTVARRMYMEAQKRDPKSAVAYTGLGRLETLEGNVAQAENSYMHALELHPNYPPALYNLGVLYSQLDGQNDQAREYFKQYLAISPNGMRSTQAAQWMSGQSVDQSGFRRPTATTSSITAEQLWNQSRAATEAGRRDEAFSLGMRALELARVDNQPVQWGKILQSMESTFGERAEILLERAQVEIQQRQWSVAQDLLVRAHAIDNRQPQVLLALADVSAKMGEYDASLLSLRQLIQLEPGNPDALWMLAEMYDKNLEIPSKAMETYRQFSTQFPADSRTMEIPRRIAALEAQE